MGSQFRIYDNDYADIIETPNALPPANNPEYSFSVSDDGHHQPLGSARMVHYFLHRDSISGTSRDHVDALPGRVERLPLNENSRQKPEWGLHFVDRISPFRIFVVVGVGVLYSAGCGIGVAIACKNVGKGAGWGALVAAVVSIFVACSALVSKA